MSNQLQLPYQDIVGPTSPVQKTIRILRQIAEQKPDTKAATEQSKSASALILTHLLGLMDGAGLINCRGYHSAAITLLRPIEDALDCFAAVSLDSEAADKWYNDELKGSDAAKIWTTISNIQLDYNKSLIEYRKSARTSLNEYSHCSPNQVNWNLYLESKSNNKCRIEINTVPLVINSNAYQIDRYICAHLLEFLEIITVAYEKYLQDNPSIQEQLKELSKEIEAIILDFLEFINKKDINITIPPEISRIKSKA